MINYLKCERGGSFIKNIATKTLIFLFLLSVCIVSAERVLAQATPLNAEAYFNLGLAHAEADRHQEAIEAFKQAIRLKPDYADVHNNPGLSYLMIGDKGSALEEYKILKTLNPEMANKLFNMIYK